MRGHLGTGADIAPVVCVMMVDGLRLRDIIVRGVRVVLNLLRTFWRKDVLNYISFVTSRGIYFGFDRESDMHDTHSRSTQLPLFVDLDILFVT